MGNHPKDLDSLNSFWAHEQAPLGVPWAKPTWSAASEWFTVTRTSLRRSAGRIRARVAHAAGFKNCCMKSGRYDGTLRNHYVRE